MATAREARIAGFCYLLVIAGGVFAALFVREALFVSGDPTATARSIAAREWFWRWGMAVHALYLFPGAAFSVILYRLFKPVHATSSPRLSATQEKADRFGSARRIDPRRRSPGRVPPDTVNNR